MEKLKALLELARPLEWSKSLMNMVFGSFLAIYLANGAFVAAKFNIALFALGAISVICLWSGLYALNDWTDHKKDRLHEVKHHRPIPSGRISPATGLGFSIILIIISFWLGAQVSQLFLFILTAMLANQLLYTIPPIKLKERPVLDLVSGSLVNPFFRFYAGWILFVPAFNAPILYLVFILGLQFGGYALYRLSSKSHEARLGHKSSIVIFRENGIKAIAYLSMLCGGFAFLASALIPRIAPQLSWLGILPLRMAILFVASIALAPFYWSALKDPEGMDMKRVYRLLYLHLIGFLCGFIILFAFF